MSDVSTVQLRASHALLLAVAVGCTAPSLPRLTRRIPLPGVRAADGVSPARIDHLAFDPGTERLFVACVGADCLAVVDLRTGQHLANVDGLREPQGVAIGPGTDAAARVYVGCGGDRSLHVLDADTLRARGSVLAGDDADNVRWDPRTRHVLVGCGGAITAIDPDTLTVVGRTVLPGHAESFRLDADGARMFVNVPDAGRSSTDGALLVADRVRGVVETAWALDGAARNYPLAYVPEHRVVLAVCRSPAVLLALDDATGTELARVPCVADCDDLFFDAASGTVFLVGGGDGADGGGLESFAMPERGVLRRVGVVPLPARARTGLLVAERRALFVAAPSARGRDAELLEFRID